MQNAVVKIIRCLAAIVMILTLLASYTPVSAAKAAAFTGFLGTCQHHQHDATCGYVAPGADKAGSSCNDPCSICRNADLSKCIAGL